MEDEILKHLYDIREAASSICRFIDRKTFEDYQQDEMLRSSVERKFEIIGEALKRIGKNDPAILEKIREYPTSLNLRAALKRQRKMSTNNQQTLSQVINRFCYIL